jgi:hypothetical protein
MKKQSFELSTAVDHLQTKHVEFTGKAISGEITVRLRYMDGQPVALTCNAVPQKPRPEPSPVRPFPFTLLRTPE